MSISKLSKAAGGLALLLLSGWGAPQRPPRLVRITGTDYAFHIPDHIRAGETIFTFENRGSVRHEMSLALVKAGVGPDSIFTTLVAGSARRDWLEGQAPLIVSRPGDHPGPGLWLDLQAGRTFLVLCTLRDTANARPHLMMCMIGKFRVEP